MTRKDLLAARANDVVEAALRRDVCLSEWECGIVREIVLAELLRVEREVLVRVTKEYCAKFHEYTNYPDSFGDWLKSQQQELES